MSVNPNLKAFLWALLIAGFVFLIGQAISEKLFLLFLPLVFIGTFWWKWPGRRN